MTAAQRLRRLTRRLATAAFARFPSLTDRWLAAHPQDPLGPPPFSPFTRKLSESRVALVTTAGVHGIDQPPFDLEDPAGDPSLRLLSAHAPASAFALSHEHYDSTDARADLGVVFPHEHLAELARVGRIGSVVEQHGGLMGHIEDRHLHTLEHETAPALAAHLLRQGAHAAVLAPA